MSALLLESGDTALLETGDYLLLEGADSEISGPVTTEHVVFQRVRTTQTAER